LISGTVTIPDGEEGELSIVLTGSTVQDGVVPVIVRNRTDDTVYAIEVSGTARSGDGTLAGSGASQGLTPPAVAPGEWAFGYVLFQGDVPSDAALDLTAAGETDDDFFGGVNATIVEHNLVPGDFGSNMLGIVANETEEEISGPVSVDLVCFDEAGTVPLSTSRGYADLDPLPAGGTSSFSVGLLADAPCPNFAMGASGYSY